MEMKVILPLQNSVRLSNKLCKEMVAVMPNLDLVSIDIISIFSTHKFDFKFNLDPEANLDLIAKMETKI